MLKDNLIAARALIDTPEKWTRHTFARNADGLPVNNDSEKAVCFCIMGAVGRVTECYSAAITPWREMTNALREANAITANFGIPHFNDRFDTTHADVLALFDEAIAACPTN